MLFLSIEREITWYNTCQNLFIYLISSWYKKLINTYLYIYGLKYLDDDNESPMSNWRQKVGEKEIRILDIGFTIS